jgi:hypothetical protein
VWNYLGLLILYEFAREPHLRGEGGDLIIAVVSSDLELRGLLLSLALLRQVIKNNNSGRMVDI